MGRSRRKEPNMSTVASSLTGGKIPCYDEVRGLMDCMLKQGLMESDARCQRQHAAAVLCMQQSQLKGGSVRAQLNEAIQRMVASFKRFGFR